MKKRKNHINLSSYPAKRDAEGLLICLNCDKRLPRKRKKYCSDDCMWDFMAKNYHSFLRDKIFERDNYTCIKCKLNPRVIMNSSGATTSDKTQLIADHIIPIALGGEEFDMKNIQTLCLNCNKIKTKLDAGKIAKQRDIEKKQKGNRLL